jgi:hypothetical protein
VNTTEVVLFRGGGKIFAGNGAMELGGGKSQWIDAQQWWDALMQLEPPERQFSE